MMLRKVIAVLLATTCILVYVVLTFADNKSVICEAHTGKRLQDQTKFAFQVGEVVSVRETRGESSLVESDLRTWGTLGGVWVPSRILANKRLFKPVASYSGERHIEVGGGDFNAEYDFDGKGSFKYHVSGDPFIQEGHLYQFKNIIWAKIESTDELDSGFMFVLEPDGRLIYVMP